MSDVQKLKDCIAEFRKANTNLDVKLKEAEERIRESRQNAREQSNRQA